MEEAAGVPRRLGRRRAPPPDLVRAHYPAPTLARGLVQGPTLRRLPLRVAARAAARLLPSEEGLLSPLSFSTPSAFCFLLASLVLPFNG